MNLVRMAVAARPDASVRRRRLLRLLGGLLAASLTLHSNAAESPAPRVVINEIMYHPPDDRDELQFVELFNPGPTDVDLSGWSFTKGVRFVFPAGTRVAAGGWVVVCRDIAAFQSQFKGEPTVAGVFTGRLSQGGERIELSDARGEVIDSVKFADRAPWPLGADGYGASLERICPGASAEDPANWASARLEPDDRLGGTPGRANSCYSTVPLPRVSDVRFDPAEPGKVIAVTARAEDANGVQSVTLAWWVGFGEGQASWTDLPMKRESGDAQRGIYSAEIPAQAEGRLVRFTVRATSTSGTERVSPSKTEPRPTYSCATFLNTNRARIPFLKVLTLGPTARPNQPRFGQRPPRRGGVAPLELRELWTSAVLCLPRDSKEVQLFDHVHLRSRKGGWKLHFHKDQPFRDMTGINLLFESSPRWVLAEPLAYDFYRKAGVPAPASEHVRLWMDQRPLGYHLLVEQPNKAFLRRQGRDEDSNVYKLLWYGNGLVGQHEKTTHRRTGHQDLVEVVEGLNGTSGTAQWDFIQNHFNVEEMVNYYAASMCLQNWDGFWNNYYACHDLRRGGKWEVFPWDEDKTWGDYDGNSSRYAWYEMPLTFGMNGDQPTRSWLGGGPFGGAAWWRPPGHFSGPLLANPEFRRRFLQRVRELCETVFTLPRMGPAINALENRLEEEVRVRAELKGQDPAGPLGDFLNNLQSFRRQVTHRREFLLKELGPAR